MSISVNLLEATADSVGVPAANGQDGYGYTGNRVITFPVPPGETYIRWKDTHVMFTISSTGSLGDQRRLSAAGSAGLIERGRFRVQGGRILEQVDSMNLISSIMALFYTDQWKYGVGRRYGYGTDLQRMADMLFNSGGTVGKRMELDLLAMGIVKTGRSFPNFAVGWAFEFQLADPRDAMVCDVVGATAMNYAVDNAQLYVTQVTGTAMLDEQIYGMWNAGLPITVPFEHQYYFPQTISVGDVLVQKNFSIARDQVILYRCRFSLVSDFTNPVVDVFQYGVNPGVDTNQLQIGGQLVPQSQIQWEGDGAENLATMHDAMYLGAVPLSAPIDNDTFYQNPPVGGVPVNASQTLLTIGLGGGRDAGIRAGLNLNLGNSGAYLRLRILAALSAAVHMTQIVTAILHLNISNNDALVTG